MKRQTRTIGSIIQINLEDDTHNYGLILDKASVAIFNIKSSTDLKISEIVNYDVLFIVAVYDQAISSGRWKIIGTTILDDRFNTLPLKFIQDPLNPEFCEIYDPNTGTMTKSTREECINLECAAVWEAEHVESRISDYFNGNENIWVKQLQIK